MLEIKKTEMALLEAVGGPQRALDSVSEVFALYSELFTSDDDTVESQIYEASMTTLSVQMNMRRRAREPPRTPVDENDDDEPFADDDEPAPERPHLLAPGPALIKDNASVRSRRSFIPSIRRKKSALSVRTKPAGSLAESIIERNRNGGQRLLRNSLQLDNNALRSVSRRCLRLIWLLVAGLFRRSELYAECASAVGEAEKMGGPGEDVYTERGLLHAARHEPAKAMACFDAALTLSVTHVPAIVGLAGVLLARPPAEQPVARDRALVLLEACTRHRGHANAEAWMLLGSIYGDMAVDSKMRDALWRCVRLEETRAVRSWDVCSV
ncbi:uncharacterized protein V1510DRAFT_422034 [Dipodascopsis tothii]|uniref:uncharacterized protein n=1 Tax=Dipodascopsis tothii TaxID=44089 RepID=UPI0034CD9632